MSLYSVQIHRRVCKWLMLLLRLTILWGFVFIYAVMATMDFGAGFWSMIYMNLEKTKATNIANRYLSPTWEVTNTFIVHHRSCIIVFSQLQPIL